MSQLRHREPILLTLILTKNICLRLVKQNEMNIGRYMFFFRPVASISPLDFASMMTYIGPFNRL